MIRGDDETGHWLALAQSLICKAGHRISIIRNENPILGRRPGQHSGVWCSFRQRIQSAHQIDAWETKFESANNLAADVGVTGQSEHRFLLWRGAVPAALHDSQKGP